MFSKIESIFLTAHHSFYLGNITISLKVVHFYAKILSIVYALVENPTDHNIVCHLCSQICNNFSGIAEVFKIKSVLDQLKKLSIDSTTLEEFKTFFKYLAFVACAAKAPVKGKMLDETLSAISKAGAAENIERWCWWTPDQLSLLEQAENLNRVILIGNIITSYPIK